MVHLIPSGASERGQVLLVTTFGIAVLLVALTLVLNASAFAQTMATTSDDDTREAIGFTVAATDGVSGAIAHANEHSDGSQSALRTDLETSVADWSASADDDAARRGGHSEVALTGSTHETRINQTDSTRDFQSGATSPESDWTLASDVTAASDLRLNVSKNSLVESDLDGDVATLTGDGVFTVLVTEDDGDTWRLFAYTNSSQVVVKVRDTSGTLHGGCTVSGPPGQDVTIDLVTGELDGSSCSSLDTFGDVESPYSIEFRSADNVVGTYTMLVEHAPTGVDDSNYADDAANGPTADGQISSATVRITYVTSSVEYVTETTVEGGDADA
ncbi:hypothetical protein ACFQJ5_10740 [Halomicroarcula sp. GCM10025324]|uniref:DUF7261 family protein n=1 Tax=Haloarcula TaxID=2237 RepID=UPI0023E7F3C2|nr:hypothetical protein [Halomicroarcula sp. ZS-22-S1]